MRRMAVLTSSATRAALDGLKESLGDRVLLDEEARAAFRSDFGRIVDRLPGAVARCASAAEVAELVRYCRRTGLPIHARGQGHTQSGQATSQGGVLLDNSAMNRIHAIDAERAHRAPATAASCGATWWRRPCRAAWCRRC